MTASTSSDPQKLRSVLPIKNSGRTDVILILEPWADEVILEPNKSCDVTIFGPPGLPRIEVNNNQLIIWAWEGTIVEAQIVDR